MSGEAYPVVFAYGCPRLNRVVKVATVKPGPAQKLPPKVVIRDCPCGDAHMVSVMRREFDRRPGEAVDIELPELSVPGEAPRRRRKVRRSRPELDRELIAALSDGPRPTSELVAELDIDIRTLRKHAEKLDEIEVVRAPAPTPTIYRLTPEAASPPGGHSSSADDALAGGTEDAI